MRHRELRGEARDFLAELVQGGRVVLGVDGAVDEVGDGFHVALPGAVGVRRAHEKPSGQGHGGSSASTYVCSRLCKDEALQR